MIVDGPHFQATDEGELVFLLTDGDNSRRPTEHDILELDEESPLRDNYYLRIPLEHPDSDRWRSEIAKYLAPLVLGGKSRTRIRVAYLFWENAHAYNREKPTIPNWARAHIPTATMGRLPWTLAAFPTGYELFLHMSPRPQGSAGSTLRRDFLLYGSTDVPFFSSPLEFVRHAEWLMRGAHRTPDRSRAPRCECKYCDVDGRNQKQSVISRELRVRRARVLAQIGDGDADADSDADA
ncbi:hypothetical protein EDB85DRAFT_2161283 [Lactarius pseudohatsudake]|nr:hypothetical protein EDB85DRAFT_2161283 [Lactarius pseudohatsudake]